jgi:hypothetical protein
MLVTRLADLGGCISLAIPPIGLIFGTFLLAQSCSLDSQSLNVDPTVFLASLGKKVLGLISQTANQGEAMLWLER